MRKTGGVRCPVVWRWVAVLVLGVSACSSNVPELLRGASAGGGYWGACPPPKEIGARTSLSLALSPEFNSRLAAEFPPGSAEKDLIATLRHQGFQPAGTCPTDARIKIWGFHAEGSGFSGPAITAQAYWQADSQDRVVWTKGFVAYTGL